MRSPHVRVKHREFLIPQSKDQRHATQVMYYVIAQQEGLYKCSRVCLFGDSDLKAKYIRTNIPIQ